MATELAKAYVQIVPSAKGISGMLQQELSGEVSSAGDSAGRTLGDCFKGALGGLGKAAGVALGAGKAAVGALAKSALDSYGDYEQLTGGIETLFKNSFGAVMQSADNAYKTAGLSANDYMETVTGFSASLLQSLGGDTEKAASMADMALTDMADNINKMGTASESVQYAYQGFAKQNYTMLDNLKLGYGGTKEEMQRLLETANELNAQQGVMTDYQISSFADIVEAIHVVQTEIGITGTTALEAGTTIQGSVASMGAAWQNLVTGIADNNADLGGLIDNLVETAATAADNIIPRIGQILSGIGEVVVGLAPVITEKLPELVETVLPPLISAGMQMVLALGQGLFSALPSLAEGAVQIISTLAAGIGEALPTLIPAAVEAILTFISGLTNPESMSNLLGGAVALIDGLIQGLAGAMPMLIAYVPEIIANLVTGLIQGIPALLEVGANLILSLGEGLIQGLAAIPEALARVVFAIVDGFKALFGIHSPSTVFAEMGGQLIAGLAEGISAAWTAITELFSSAASALMDFLSSAWDGIRESAVSAWESIKDALASVWEDIKGVFEGMGAFFSGVFEAAAQGVTSAWEGVTAFFSSVAEGVQSAFDGVSAFLSDAFSAAWEAVQSAWQAAVEFFGGVWDGIQSGVGAAGEAIGGALSGAWEAIQSAWGAAGDFFAGILDTIIGTFQNVGSTFLEIGGNIVNGIRDGISGAWQALTSFISEKVQGLVGGVKGLLGIHSPSTVFAGIGGNMALGIGEGWGGQFGRVRAAIEKNMTFSAAAVGVQADVSALSGGTAQRGTGRGDTYVTINSPKAVDAVQAAREWRKTTQRMAMGYV